MEFREVVERRRTTRQFQNRPVEEEKIRRIIDAGLKAPTFDHMRRWEFVVVTDGKTKSRVLESIEALPCGIVEPKTPLQEMVKIAFPRQRSMFEEAGCLLLPIFKKDARLLEEKNVRRLMDFAAMWCVIENIFLAATDEGLSCAMRIPTSDEIHAHDAKVSTRDQATEILSAVGCPTGYVLPCLIGIGYAADNALYPTQIRPSFDECVHWNQF